MYLPPTDAGRGRDPVRVLNLLSRLSRGGGIPKVVREIVARSDREVVEHHVCQIRPLHDADFDEAILDRVALHSLDLVEETAPARLARSPGAAYRFAKIVGQVRPDVVHLHTGTSLLAVVARVSTGRRAAWLLDYHEPLEMRHSIVTTRAVNVMVRRLGFSAVTHSSAVTSRIDRALGGSVSLHMIPLGVDTAVFRAPAEERRSWRLRHGWDPDAPLVIGVGRLAPLKGFREFLDVARAVLQRIPSVQFAIVGAGPLEEELAELSRAYGIDHQVRIMGFVDDLVSALAAADVFLTTSRYEGFGIAVLEAMASGLPVVATRIDGIVDLVVEGETGFLVRPDHPGGYVDRVLELVGDSQRCSTLALNARRRASELFDIARTVRAYETLYSEMAANSRFRMPGRIGLQ